METVCCVCHVCAWCAVVLCWDLVCVYVCVLVSVLVCVLVCFLMCCVCSYVAMEGVKAVAAKMPFLS